jgi:hypothetical protein
LEVHKVDKHFGGIDAVTKGMGGTMPSDDANPRSLTL